MSARDDLRALALRAQETPAEPGDLDDIPGIFEIFDFGVKVLLCEHPVFLRSTGVTWCPLCGAIKLASTGVWELPCPAVDATEDR